MIKGLRRKQIGFCDLALSRYLVGNIKELPVKSCTGFSVSNMRKKQKEKKNCWILIKPGTMSSFFLSLL